MEKIDAVHASIRTAEDWEKKGEMAWVLSCLSSVLTGYLSLAVVNESDSICGITWLKSQNVSLVLQKYFNSLCILDAQVASENVPISVIGGNYQLLVYSHLSWCIDEYDLGESFAKFAAREDIAELSTPFWREYSRGMRSLVGREPYRLTQLRTKGQEKYWISYLRLVESFCNHADVKDDVDRIHEQFKAKNCDKNIRDDFYEIEGSGLTPAQWDFRLQGLLNYLATQ